MHSPGVTTSNNMLEPLTPEQDILDLRDLMKSVVLERNRPKRIYISLMNLLFTVIQGCLVITIMFFTPQMIKNDMIWGCWESPAGLYIGVLWAMCLWTLAAFVGTFTESSFIKADEILHLSPLTAATILGDCEYCSLDSAPPPARVLGPIAQCRSYLMRNRGTFTLGSTTLNIQQYVSGIILLFKDLVIIQKSLHPMILILRPATDTGQYPRRPEALLYIVGCGFLQASLLIALTILFGSTFSLGILETTVFILYFLGVTVTSRTYSIYHCLWMEQALSVTIIEYRTLNEHNAIKAIVAGMPSVVVENRTDGSTYGDGFRLDHNPHCPNHSRASPRPCPRTFGRLLGLSVAIGLPAVVLTCIFVILQSFYLPLDMIYVIIVLTCASFISSSIISQFDDVDIHRGNRSAGKTAYGPISQA